jgi:hypothetical protein
MSLEHSASYCKSKAVPETDQESFECCGNGGISVSADLTFLLSTDNTIRGTIHRSLLGIRLPNPSQEQIDHFVEPHDIHDMDCRLSQDVHNNNPHG